MFVKTLKNYIKLNKSMAAKTEESLISIAEKELAGFVQEKTNAESALKEELAKAKSEYDTLVKEIEAKYNVGELTEKIKRHTYFTKLLKGEVSFPEDTEASRRKTKSDSTSRLDLTRVSDWGGKITSALSKINKTIADKPAPKDIRAALIELYPNLKFESGAFNAAWTKFKKDNK